jgi:hypothetical protein
VKEECSSSGISSGPRSTKLAVVKSSMVFWK